MSNVLWSNFLGFGRMGCIEGEMCIKFFCIVQGMGKRLYFWQDSTGEESWRRGRGAQLSLSTMVCCTIQLCIFSANITAD